MMRKRIKYRDNVDEMVYMTDRTLLWLEGEVNPGLFFVPSNQSVRKRPSTESLAVNYNSNSDISRLSSVSTLKGSLREVKVARRNSSRYKVNDHSTAVPSVLSNFLDLLTMCLWKCSTGCQQVPDRN